LSVAHDPETGLPKLSIVLATTHEWPEAAPTLRAIFDAPPGEEIEVLLCDGHGGGAPPEHERDPRLRVVTMPGTSVFDLRARGISMARGGIVAITEDHCVPAPDWPAEVLAAHARHPEAPAIAGAVTNGAADSAWDWANFLMTFAEHLPPMPAKPTVRAPSVANGSVDLAAAGVAEDLEPGWLETELLPRLTGEGLVARDDGPRVSHVQSHGGARGTLAAHFHNGRATAGLRVDRPGGRALWAERGRIAKSPLRLTRELHAALADRPPLGGRAAAGARLVPLLAAAHTLGEAVGLMAGPGRSAEHLD
jgi:hypothetical protein